MQRVVVFMGGSRETMSAVQRTLPTCIRALSASGVVVPRAGRRGKKATGFTHQGLTLPAKPLWGELQRELAQAQGETAFLVIPGLLRVGRSDTRRTAMLERLAALADEVCLVSVVGDQLTLINDAYVSLVAAWRVSKRFEAALPQLIESDAFVHERQLGPWYDARTPARYVAVPLPEFEAGHPVAVVLEASGVPLTRSPAAAGLAGAPKLGPVGVEANRLLTTYLRAKVPDFDPTEPRMGAASRAALARAQKLGWCSSQFWGWSRRTAGRTLATFEASNQRFAQAVWGTPWTIPYPLERPCSRVEFLDLEVLLVDQVQRYVVTTASKVGRERTAAP